MKTITIVCLGIVVAVAVSCAAVKSVCPIIDLASEICPMVAVKMPDGTTEYVPKNEVGQVAMRARAARLVPDAGAGRD